MRDAQLIQQAGDDKIDQVGYLFRVVVKPRIGRQDDRTGTGRGKLGEIFRLGDESDLVRRGAIERRDLADGARAVAKQLNLEREFEEDDCA